MNRMRTILVLFCILGISTSVVVLAGQDEDDTLCLPTGTIVIEAPGSVEPKRTPVDFPHSIHFNNNCKTCHHIWEGEPELLSCTTSDCHDLEKLPKKGTSQGTQEDLEILYYKKAYHTLCIGCHKEIKIKNKQLATSATTAQDQLMKAGPTGCVKCHPKE